MIFFCLWPLHTEHVFFTKKQIKTDEFCAFSSFIYRRTPRWLSFNGPDLNSINHSKQMIRFLSRFKVCVTFGQQSSHIVRLLQEMLHFTISEWHRFHIDYWNDNIWNELLYYGTNWMQLRGYVRSKLLVATSTWITTYLLLSMGFASKKNFASQRFWLFSSHFVNLSLNPRRVSSTAVASVKSVTVPRICSICVLPIAVPNEREEI